MNHNNYIKHPKSLDHHNKFTEVIKANRLILDSKEKINIIPSHVIDKRFNEVNTKINELKLINDNTYNEVLILSDEINTIRNLISVNSLNHKKNLDEIEFKFNLYRLIILGLIILDIVLMFK